MPSALEYVNGYAIWALFGLLGWHHLCEFQYLARPSEHSSGLALVMQPSSRLDRADFGRYMDAIAFGQSLGIFGIGWLLDVFFIHKYVQERAKSTGSRTAADAPRPPAGLCHRAADFIYSAFSVAGFACLYGALAEVAWTSVVAIRDVEGVAPRAAAYAIVSACTSAGAYFAARWRNWDVDYLAAFLSAFTWVGIAESRGAVSSLVLVAASTAPLWTPTRWRGLEILPQASAILGGAVAFREFFLSREMKRSGDDEVVSQVPVALVAALGAAFGIIVWSTEQSLTRTAHPAPSVGGPALTALSPASSNSPVSIDAPGTTSLAPTISAAALANAEGSEFGAGHLHAAPPTEATEPPRAVDPAHETEPPRAVDATDAVPPTQLLQSIGAENPIGVAHSTTAAEPVSAAVTSGSPAIACALESPRASLQSQSARMDNCSRCKYIHTGGRVVGSLVLQAAWLLLAIFLFFLNVEVTLDLSGEFNDSGRYRVKVGRLIWARAGREELIARLDDSFGLDPRYLPESGLEKYEEFQPNKWLGKSDYAILGVQDGAPLADVKSAFRSLVRQVHPDRFPHHATARQRAGATTHFRIIQAAYDRLSRISEQARDDRVRPSQWNRHR